MTDGYESDALLRQYLDFHYRSGDPDYLPHHPLPDGVLDYPRRCAALLIEYAETTDHALDLGCAVGGASFELATAFNTVTGIDFSSAFIRAATALAREGVFRLPEPSLGDGQGVVPRAAGASFGQAPRERPGDPRNGLCLSATYDKAFDQHLISFDEDYRLVVAPEIRDHYRNDHAREADEVPELVEGFEKREGQGISLPKKHDHWPLREYLVSHREQLHRIC